MITTFTADREAAASADQSYVDRVNSSGKYIVNVYQVSTDMTMGGSQYVQLDFQTKAHAFGSVRIYVTKKDGSRNFGADILYAIMTICDVRKAEAKPANVYIDPNDKERKMTGYRIPALEKKDLGLLLKCGADFGETYENKEGEIKTSYQLELVCAFDPATEKTANELINGKEASTVQRRYERLMRDIENAGNVQQPEPARVSAPAASPTKQSAAADSIDTLEEDLPF